MTRLWKILTAITLAYLAYFWISAPDRVAVRFNFAGEPIAFWSKSVATVYLIALMMLLNGTIFFLLREEFLLRYRRWVNVPYKKFWFSHPDRTKQLMVRMRIMQGVAGSFTSGIVLFCIHIMATENGLHRVAPLNVTCSVWVILGLSLLMVIWSVWYFHPRRLS